MVTWSQRIADLRESGLTLREIGELVGMSTGGVSDIAQGRTTQPSGDAAIALHQLHQRKCARRRRSAPRSAA